MNATRVLIFAAMILLGAARVEAETRPQISIGSKAFTESVILAEAAAQLARTTGATVTAKHQLGGTRILYNALVRGQIDAYPEYTGTIRQEIFAGKNLRNEDDIRKALAEVGIEMTPSLGFNNTYAIGLPEAKARQLGIATISDLRNHPELRLGFSNEFMDRGDGWPGLQKRYNLPQTDVRGMDHDLAYRALQGGSIDATDLYSTDAEIRYYHLKVLDDDLHYFPEYRAVYLYRSDLRQRAPKVVEALEALAGKIDERQMVEMNARVKLDRVPEAQVAADFLKQAFGVQTGGRGPSLWERLRQRTAEHLFMVVVSLALAIVVAIPLGIVAAKHERFGQVILGIVAAIYTIPSLALLVFMIPLLGIGRWPAIAALFLYSLLPIVRNTQAGLRSIPAAIRESAEVLGLPARTRLLRVELPMASSAILAGIKTSAVINVGTATLGALIGAGGYGQPILTGIRLDNIGLILEGAVPAALLALLVQGAFELAERRLVPAGLRLKTQGI